MSKQNKFAAQCPECGATVRFKDVPRLGQPMACPLCRVSLQVARTKPIELDLAEESVVDRPDRKRDRTPSKRERRREFDFEF